jgi:hypothetical protein
MNSHTDDLEGTQVINSPADTESTPQPRPPVSVIHLVMGLVFLGTAGAWALHEADVIGPVDVEWLMPLILVVAGAAGLLASVARNLVGRSRRDG